MDILEGIAKSIAAKYSPEMIILFGSVAKRRHTVDSDIDLCVVLEFEDKVKTTVDMQLDLHKFGKALDIVLYTPEKWAEYSILPGSFAHKIKEEGEVLYAR